MKRILICAAAAIVALASCSKTQVVYNDAPEEIGFKAVTGAMTKAPLDGTDLPTDQGNMMVYASKSAEETGTYTEYFSKQEFSWKDTYWGGTTAQYWPESGYLKFIAYYPSTIGTNVTGDATQPIVISGVDANAQTDILYTKLTEARSCETKSAVPMTFYHALAQVQVTAKVSDANMKKVKVTSVVLTSAPMTGTLTLTGTDATWASQAVGANPITMDNVISGTDLTTTSAPLGKGTLVVPNAQTATLTVTYTIDGLQTTTDPISIAGTWEKGKKYIYNLSIGLEEIVIEPEVSDWASAETVQSNPSI